MSELHWTAEETRKGWGIRYNPTPGGVKNANGTTSFSLSFVALELTDMVSEAEDAAKSIARELNSYADILAALKEMVRWNVKRGGEDDLPLPADEQDPECAQAMAAIARAEGI